MDQSSKPKDLVLNMNCWEAEGTRFGGRKNHIQVHVNPVGLKTPEAEGRRFGEGKNHIQVPLMQLIQNCGDRDKD